MNSSRKIQTGDVVEICIRRLEGILVKEEWVMAHVKWTTKDKMLVKPNGRYGEHWIPLDQYGHMWR